MPVTPLLRTNSLYRHFWLARTISFLGDTMTTTALVLYAYQVGTVGTAVGTLLFVQAIPRLFGPLAGSLADRVDQRTLMIGCDLGQALLFGAMALFIPSFPVLLVFVGLSSLLATLFTPAGRSALPLFVSHHDLPTANALLGTGINTSLALGPALGGILTDGLGVQSVLWLNVLSFLGSALLLYRLPPLPPIPHENEAVESLWATTKSGLVYLSRHKMARAVVVSLFLVVAFAALDNVALVFLARDVFHTDEAGYGLLSSIYGLGMVLGPVALLRTRRSFNARPVLLLGVVLTGLGELAAGIVPWFGLAVLVQGIAGIGNGLENVANDTLIQQTVPRAMLGRVFGTVSTSAFIASSLAYAVGGFLLDWTSPQAVFVIAGSGVLASLGVLWFMLPAEQDA